MSDLDLSPDGDIVLAGNFSGDVGFPGANTLISVAPRPWLAQFTSSGGLIRVQAFGPGNTGGASSTGVRAGSDGSLYLAGVCDTPILFPGTGVACTPTGVNPRTGFVVRLGPDGGATWIQQYFTHNGTYLRFLEMGRVGFSKAAGRVLALGGFGGWLDIENGPQGINIQTPGSGADFWGASDLDGGLAYNRVSGCANNSMTAIREVAATAAGDWYVALWGRGNCGGIDYGAEALGVIRATADAGMTTWTQKYDGLVGRNEDFSITADNGRVWLAASFRGPFDAGAAGVFMPRGANDLALVQLNRNNGAVISAVQVGGVGTEHVARVALDDDGGVWLYGDFSGAGFGSGALRANSLDGGNDIFLMRFNAGTGAPLELRTIAGPGEDRASGFAVSTETLIVSGTFTQTLLGLEGEDGGLWPPANWGPARAFVGTLAR